MICPQWMTKPLHDRAASRLEEFLASADLSDLRSVLRMLGDAGGAPRGGAAVSFAANNATAAGAAPPKPKRKGFTLDADWDMVPKKKAPKRKRKAPARRRRC